MIWKLYLTEEKVKQFRCTEKESEERSLLGDMLVDLDHDFPKDDSRYKDIVLSAYELCDKLFLFNHYDQVSIYKYANLIEISLYRTICRIYEYEDGIEVMMTDYISLRKEEYNAIFDFGNAIFKIDSM